MNDKSQPPAGCFVDTVWGNFMNFGAGIRKLDSIFALALLLLVTSGAVASQQQAQTTRVKQSQSQPTEPHANDPAISPQLLVPTTSPPPIVTPPVAVPPATTPPVTTPPVFAPTVITPPVVTPAPKPRKKGPVDALKPGDFVWVPQDVYEGPMKIVIVLDIQRIYVFQNDVLIGFSTISSGKKGKETPTGFFNILQKNVDHKSNLYSNAPMPYMQRLTWDGIAIHGGHLPGYPASHGCIRLPLTFAKMLYGVTQMNQEVFVLKDTATPVKRPEPKPVEEPAVQPMDPAVDPAQPVTGSTPEPANTPLPDPLR